MHQYKITLAIPTYNRDKFLKRTLENVKNEINRIEDSSVKIEVLVSDNYSEDSTQIVCQEFSQEYEDFTYNKNEKNLGYKGNILKLLQLAQGKYIWFMGDDDGVANNGFNTLLEAIKDYNADLFFGDSFDDAIQGKCYFRWQKHDLKLDFKNFCTEKIYRNTGKISNFIVNTNIAKEIISKYNINNVWPQISMSLYILNIEGSVYLLKQPISLRFNSEENLQYDAIGVLNIFVKSYMDIFEEAEKNLNSENVKVLEDTKYYISDAKQIFVLSAFLNNYFELLNLNINLAKRMSVKQKIKFFIFFLFPNLIPCFIKKFIIKSTGYLVKGKTKTDNFIEKMKIRKDILDGKNKDKSARSVLTFND